MKGKNPLGKMCCFVFFCIVETKCYKELFLLICVWHICGLKDYVRIA